MTAETRPILTSLRDTLAFPSFAWCPHENDIPQDYYHLRHDQVFSPSRHWCFLGEITDISTILRLRLWVQDKNGWPTIPIAFHLDTHDGPAFRIIMREQLEAKIDHPNVPQHLIKKGNTIAVLYAEQHPFFDGTIGLRIEDASVVQIFPCSLEKMLTLSDQICLASCANRPNGDRLCGRCGAAASRLCTGCRLVRYCNKDCQVADWSEDGHKNECKLTKQVARLMKQDWQRFATYYSFPLPKK